LLCGHTAVENELLIGFVLHFQGSQAKVKQ
jgi:hypothetical protein